MFVGSYRLTPGQRRVPPKLATPFAVNSYFESRYQLPAGAEAAEATTAASCAARPALAVITCANRHRRYRAGRWRRRGYQRRLGRRGTVAPAPHHPHLATAASISSQQGCA